MNENKYRLDENNRLIIKKGGKKVSPKGKFVIDKKNRLGYVITEAPIWRKKYSLPQKITLEGSWEIDKNHDLIFTLIRTRQKAAGTHLYFKSELLASQANKLIFSLASQEKEGLEKIYLLKLEGKWQADIHNRLCFLVQRSGTRYDTLTLGAGWEVNENNTLIYRYQKISLKRKEKIEKTLTFQGFWQIDAKNKLTYSLDLENKSAFCFKAGLETPSILGKNNTIKYRTAIGIKGGRLFKVQTVTLYGLWKFSRQLGLCFEMDYERYKVKEISFGATCRLTDTDEITFQLKNSEGKDLGLSVNFSRTFLNKNARWFIRLTQDAKASRVEGGITILW